MLGAWVGGLSMTTHVAADDTKFAGEQRYPVMPETQIAAEAVLNPNRLGLLPRLGEVVEFVVHLVIIGYYLGHSLTVPACAPAKLSRLSSPVLGDRRAGRPPSHGVYTFRDES